MNLDALRDQIDELATLPPDETARAWARVREQVDFICTHLAKGDGAEAQAHLPLLAEMITQLDRVIDGMEQGAGEQAGD